jgi:hypothetical protein
MKQRMEQYILLAIAIVSGAAAFGLDATSGGLMLAALNVSLAFCVKLRCRCSKLAKDYAPKLRSIPAHKQSTAAPGGGLWIASLRSQ